MDHPTLHTPHLELGEADPAAVLAEVRAQIRQRQARLGGAGGVPGGGGVEFNLGQVRQSVDEVNDLWFVSAHLPITWSVPGVGPALAYAKKAVRVLLRWYINPIVEQQNRFNSAVARALVEITTYQERLTREWQALDARVAALEDAVGRRQDAVGSDAALDARAAVPGSTQHVDPDARERG